jgi:hypothetical protein
MVQAHLCPLSEALHSHPGGPGLDNVLNFHMPPSPPFFLQSMNQ